MHTKKVKTVFENYQQKTLVLIDKKTNVDCIPLLCKDVGSDEPEYCKFPFALPSLRTVRLSLSLADSISRLASLSVIPSVTE